MNERNFRVTCSVYILFVKDKNVLMYRRINTDWQNGKYNVPGGHLEQNETAMQGAVREAIEETGLVVSEKDLKLVHVLHRLPKSDKTAETNQDNIDLFFEARKWTGEPKITEENKSDKMIWTPIENLPDDTLLFEKYVIGQILNKEIYSEFSG